MQLSFYSLLIGVIDWGEEDEWYLKASKKNIDDIVEACHKVNKHRCMMIRENMIPLWFAQPNAFFPWSQPRACRVSGNGIILQLSIQYI